MLEHLGRYLIERRIWVLVVVLGLTSVFGYFAYRVPCIKRSLRLRRVHDKFGPIDLEVQAFQALACRHQLRLGQVYAATTHAFIVF